MELVEPIGAREEALFDLIAKRRGGRGWRRRRRRRWHWRRRRHKVADARKPAGARNRLFGLGDSFAVLVVETDVRQPPPSFCNKLVDGVFHCSKRVRPRRTRSTDQAQRATPLAAIVLVEWVRCLPAVVCGVLFKDVGAAVGLERVGGVVPKPIFVVAAKRHVPVPALLRRVVDVKPVFGVRAVAVRRVRRVALHGLHEVPAHAGQPGTIDVVLSRFGAGDRRARVGVGVVVAAPVAGRERRRRRRQGRRRWRRGRRRRWRRRRRRRKRWRDLQDALVGNVDPRSGKGICIRSVKPRALDVAIAHKSRVLVDAREVVYGRERAVECAPVVLAVLGVLKVGARLARAKGLFLLGKFAAASAVVVVHAAEVRIGTVSQTLSRRIGDSAARDDVASGIFVAKTCDVRHGRAAASVVEAKHGVDAAAGAPKVVATFGVGVALAIDARVNPVVRTGKGVASRHLAVFRRERCASGDVRIQGAAHTVAVVGAFSRVVPRRRGVAVRKKAARQKGLFVVRPAADAAGAGVGADGVRTAIGDNDGVGAVHG